MNQYNCLSCLSVQLLNPFHSDGISQTYCYNKHGIVHFVFEGVTELNMIMSLKIIFILANSADPDEIQPYAAFHPGLHCLPKYLFTGIQNEKG